MAWAPGPFAMQLLLRLCLLFAVCAPALSWGGGTVPAVQAELWKRGTDSPSAVCGSGVDNAYISCGTTPASAAQAFADYYGGAHASQFAGTQYTSTYISGSGHGNFVYRFWGCDTVTGGWPACPGGSTYDSTYKYVSTAPACPEHSSGLSGGSCTCDSGYDAVGGVCVPSNQCSSKAGNTGWITLTSGWTRSSTADANDYVVDYPYPADASNNISDGQCVGTVENVDACYRSQVPASNGLYRVSCTYRVNWTGAQGAQGSPGADPNAAPPSCPGAQGTVNGVPVCLGGTPSPPTSTPQPPSPPPQSYGNPRAGTRPASGSGSGAPGTAGATPEAGDGGNGGGPAAAANPNNGLGGAGPGGSGAAPGGAGGNQSGEEGDPTPMCGRPDSPPCRIDESGTPGAGGAFGGAGSALDSAFAAREGQISGVGGHTVPWQLPWSFPIGSCHPLTLVFKGHEITANPCGNSMIALVRSLWAYCCAVFAVIYGWQTVTANRGFLDKG